jgi:hypothetical protein
VMMMLVVAAHREVLGTGRVVGGKAHVATGGISEVYTETDSWIEPILAIGALVFGVPNALWDVRTEFVTVSEVSRVCWCRHWWRWECWGRRRRCSGLDSTSDWNVGCT